MSPLQEGVVKAVIVAASLAAGGTVFTGAITNATQNERIDANRKGLESIEEMKKSISRIETTVAVIEERTRHESRD